MGQQKNRNQGSTLGDFFSDALKKEFKLDEKPKEEALVLPNETNVPVNKGRMWVILSDESPNIGWLFYKDYYSFKDANGRIRISEKIGENNKKKVEVTVTGLKEKNEILFCRNLAVYSPPSVSTAHQFCLTTTYPGLLIGSGLAHAAGGQDEEFKLGFSFDHTSGLPYLPASSVKGVLRSLFSYLQNEQISDEDFTAFMTLIFEEEIPDFGKSDLKTFIQHSFGSQTEGGKDIFLDAFPVPQKDEQGTPIPQPFIGSDSITPHNKNPLKNPTPVAFIKVLPEVTIQFSFILKPFSIGEKEILSVEKKEKLFKNTLLYQGIGAKTNVGYGQLK